jgi:hypothetical protein
MKGTPSLAPPGACLLPCFLPPLHWVPPPHQVGCQSYRIRSHFLQCLLHHIPPPLPEFQDCRQTDQDIMAQAQALHMSLQGHISIKPFQEDFRTHLLV